MTCHAVPGSPPPSSSHLGPAFTSVHPSPSPLPPPGGSLIPLAPHPLPHRSALMSGKNKTASPTAKTEFHPPLRRRTTRCIGKKGSRESETSEGNTGLEPSRGSKADEEGKTGERGVGKREGKREGKEAGEERRRRAKRAEFQEVRR